MTPFDCLWIVVRNGSNKRVYSKRSPARARVTSSVDKSIERFVFDVELWTVGADGWKLVFEASAGMHADLISWETNRESRKRAEVRAEAERGRREEAEARRQYAELRKRFE